MSDSGASTAAAMMTIVSARGMRARNAAPVDGPTIGAGGLATVAIEASLVGANVTRAGRKRRLLVSGRQRRFPIAQELEPLLRVEIRHDLRAHRYRLHVGPELLVQACRRVLGVDVVANREQLDVAADPL